MQTINNLHAIAIEGHWNYVNKINTFYEQNSKVGVFEIV
jgi:hypothetical protein